MSIAVDSATRDGNKLSVFNRLGATAAKPLKVCHYWRSGRCNRNPCPFLHRELPPSPNINGITSNWPRNSAYSNTWVRQGAEAANVPHKTQNKNNSSGLISDPRKTEDRVCPDVPPKLQESNHGAGLDRVPGKMQDKVCRHWLTGNCSDGDKCKYLHSWFLSDSFTLLKKLEGHQKGINGVALPSGSDKLYSGSEDQSIRFWDCYTGQCAAVVNLGGEIGCMISEGPWLFVGIPKGPLSGPVGQVHSLAVENGILFAGNQDGKILAWKIDAASDYFQPVVSLEGHNLAIVSLVVGAGRLYSGLMDHTIRAWAATESGDIVVHTHNEENGVLTLCVMHDGQMKPVLMCSCDDNTVHIYDLPSFSERGRIFSKEEVWVIQIAPDGIGLFFTGDGAGELSVWQWASEPQKQPEEPHDRNQL